ncbi:MAG: SprT family zinc-dependent metalloprotease [Gemmatimonadota bacterium]
MAASHSETEILALLRKRGAKHLKHVRFRANRSTIWSLTQDGGVLNLHVGYRRAPKQVLEAFAVIASSARGTSASYRRATAIVRNWPGLESAMEELAIQSGDPRLLRLEPGPCIGSEAQRSFLRRMYRHLNRQRFAGVLPDDLPVRVSGRMVSRLGQMVPGLRFGRRVVIELALNVDLFLAGNDRELVETFAHEMAHAADYLLSGRQGHGASWKRWARIAGCEPVACTHHPIRHRTSLRQVVTRVPPWPFSGRRRSDSVRIADPLRPPLPMQLNLFQ